MHAGVSARILTSIIPSLEIWVDSTAGYLISRQMEADTKGSSAALLWMFESAS